MYPTAHCKLILGLGRVHTHAGTLMSRLTETDCSLVAEFIGGKQPSCSCEGGFVIPTNPKFTSFSYQGATIEHDMWLKMGAEHGAEELESLLRLPALLARDDGCSIADNIRSELSLARRGQRPKRS